MMYKIRPTARFQKDLKRAQKRGCDLDLLADVLKQLAAGQALAQKYHDHPLVWDYSGCRECNITPDWLLVYEIDQEEMFLYLVRTGTHSDLF